MVRPCHATYCRGSKDPKFDRLSGIGQCGKVATSTGPYQDRCGHGPRLPFLIISPWAKVNFVDHDTAESDFNHALYRGQLGIGTNWK